MVELYFIVFLTFCVLLLSAQKEPLQTNNARETVDTATNKPGYVIAGADTLFSINTALDSFSAVERAVTVNKRLKQLKHELSINVEDFSLVEEVNGPNLRITYSEYYLSLFPSFLCFLSFPDQNRLLLKEYLFFWECCSLLAQHLQLQILLPEL